MLLLIVPYSMKYIDMDIGQDSRKLLTVPMKLSGKSGGNMANRNWATVDEKAFIDRLGMHRIYGGPTKNYMKSPQYKERRIACLSGYIEAAKARTDWGEINSTHCVLHALYCRAKEQGKYQQINKPGTAGLAKCSD